MSRTRRQLIPLAAALAGALPGAAAAQDPGVTIDPDAPSSKEYAIPLEDARREAAGGESRLGRPAQGERSAPLFGEGIGDGGADAPAATAPDAGEARPGARPARRRDRARRSERAPSGSGQSEQEGSATERTETAEASAAGDGDLGAPLTVAALAGSVLLLGGVIGSIARRRRA